MSVSKCLKPSSRLNPSLDLEHIPPYPSFSVRYQISHTTTYRYSQPVTLQPHMVRLRPRSDGHQTLQSFTLQVAPVSQQQCHLVDLEGNETIKLWFNPESTEELSIQVQSQVETHCVNPFNYLMEPWALHLPIDYPSSFLAQIQPYLAGSPGHLTHRMDGAIVQLAHDIHHRVNGNTSLFLSELTQEIYTTCKHLIRETGDPFPSGLTWAKRAGSCRDLTVLFMDVCRTIGLPARFVSGYQEGDLNNPERHLHAWAEVYLPGAGWRGFDPTHGLAVADRHIALVASSIPSYTAPLPGAYSPGAARSTMSYDLIINVIA